MLNKTKIVEIWNKFFISRVILKADHIWEIPELGEFCGYCFKNHVNIKVGWQLTVRNKLQDQRRLSSRLATVMFRRPPRILLQLKPHSNMKIFRSDSCALVFHTPCCYPVHYNTARKYQMLWLMFNWFNSMNWFNWFKWLAGQWILSKLNPCNSLLVELRIFIDR